MCVVVDGLTSKVPHTVGDSALAGPVNGPHINVYSICDALTRDGRRLECWAHQRSHQATT